MELRDLIVTPLVLILVYVAAYFTRPWVTDNVTRRYFLPALTVRIIGALAVGFIYQFYYDGGDTFNYHTHGSRHLWEAFWESPDKAFKMFFNAGSDLSGVYKYASRIYFINDPSSFVIIRIAFLFDLITFSSYSATAVLFALLSFVGMWMFFLTFYRRYPQMHGVLATCSFFIPSVFFWGSGILKDTITLAALGAAVFLFDGIFILGRMRIIYFVGLLLSLFALYVIKIYILLVLLPAAVIWIFLSKLELIRSKVIKLLLFPPVLSAAVILGYFALVKAGEDNPRYSLDKVAQTAKITAYDIRYWTGRSAGSGYSLGELDGSMRSMIRLAPQAINVSFFRPYLWEVKNPLMLLSALESAICFGLVLYFVFFRLYHFRAKNLVLPDLIFLILFAIVFGFAVGVSTFNFGTLVRYKIPMLPLLATAIGVLFHFSKSDKKLAVFASTE